MPTTDDIHCLVHLLDVGPEQYGDCLLIELGDVTVLVDGAHRGNAEEEDGHPSIPDQIASKLGLSAPPYAIDLLVVSHAHEDHIGCLPELVAAGVIRPKYALVADADFGWGRVDSDVHREDALDPRATAVLAALREEVRDERATDAEVERVLQDAATLETRYRKMLTELADGGCKVLRYGRSGSTGLGEYLASKSVTLDLLGPRKAALLAAARRLGSGLDAFATKLAPGAVDAALDAKALYRSAVKGIEDTVDAGRPGHYVNAQSIVMTLEYEGYKLLLLGDYQLAALGTADETIVDERDRIVEAIETEAPYAFLKLSHHGSWNGIDADLFERMGRPRVVGICAGEGSTHHPDAGTLALLDSHRREIDWARTDRNGLTTIDLAAGRRAKITKTRGRLDDPTPNSTDEGSTSSPHSRTAELIAPSPRGAGDGVVEVRARIPASVGTVTITVDIGQGASGASKRPRTPVADPPPRSPLRRPPSPPARARAPFALAGGRSVDGLVFVLDRKTLEANASASARNAINALVQSGADCLDLGAMVARDVRQTSQAIAAHIAKRASPPRGVVIVGAYDTVAAARIDTLPPSLRSDPAVALSRDHDAYVVWSDDPLVDVNSDGWPEFPVSRVPQGRDGELLAPALGAASPGSASRGGVRNIARPFADEIHALLPGTDELQVSHPTVFNGDPLPDCVGDWVYFMLHGAASDATRFWGEQVPGDTAAVHIGSVPSEATSIVLAGCCWGALSVDLPARHAANGFKARTAQDSIALRYLASGALAFVGCTGTHYSPVEAPYQYFGGPMHRSFIEHCNAGRAPAEALFLAKRDYAAAMPHGQTAVIPRAIEYKILRQFTCLGLGW